MVHGRVLFLFVCDTRNEIYVAVALHDPLAVHDKDVGSTAVQIGLLTDKMYGF